MHMLFKAIDVEFEGERDPCMCIYKILTVRKTLLRVAGEYAGMSGWSGGRIPLSVQYRSFTISFWSFVEHVVFYTTSGYREGKFTIMNLWCLIYYFRRI